MAMVYYSLWVMLRLLQNFLHNLYRLWVTDSKKKRVTNYKIVIQTFIYYVVEIYQWCSFSHPFVISHTFLYYLLWNKFTQAKNICSKGEWILLYPFFLCLVWKIHQPSEKTQPILRFYWVLLASLVE